MSSGLAKFDFTHWYSRQQIRALIFSGLVLMLALCTLWLGHWLPTNLPDQIEVRQISIAVPPPPPPPPPVQQQVVETPVSIQVQGAGPSIPLVEIQQRMDPIKPDIPVIDTQQTKWQSLDIDWNAFDLDALDGLPTLLTNLRVTFPKSLTRRGVQKVLVKLDVIIDEQGQVTLIDIIENPHPELVGEIQRLVRNSRFTAPEKDDMPVRARFIWPVEIGS